MVDVRSIQLCTTVVGMNSRDACSALGCSATYRSANPTKSPAIFMATALLFTLDAGAADGVGAIEDSAEELSAKTETEDASEKKEGDSDGK